MEYRTLDLTLVSAKGLTNPDKLDLYAVASISSPTSKGEKFKTPVDRDAGSNSTWNFPMKFTVDETAGHNNLLTLVVTIKVDIRFADKFLGEVRVPVKELLEGVTPEGKTMGIVSYPVIGRYGEANGVLDISYSLGKINSNKRIRLPPLLKHQKFPNLIKK